LRARGRCANVGQQAACVAVQQDAEPKRMAEPGKRVGLFVTCLVDLIRPSIGFAAVKLLEDAGCTVAVPAQSCCGQPAYNSGDRATTRAIAEQVITTFAPYDYVVAPSGSCAGMMKTHYPDLFRGDAQWGARAETFCAKTFELVSFLVDVLKIEGVTARFDGSVTYHDACSGLRELGIRGQPRRLLAGVEGLTLREMDDSDVCCGFGGTFCVKYPAISDAIVMKKQDNIAATGAQTVLAGDLGCLMNIAGKLQRQGRSVQVRHVAEVLAGMAGIPAIGEKAPDAAPDQPDPVPDQPRSVPDRKPPEAAGETAVLGPSP
jgi:L-lactate dehydrogenase complex protein LldE